MCADAQDLIAYSKNGLIWTIDHLALDDLQITLVSREAIKGFARDPASGKVPFSVDPVTGRLEGGSELATVSNSGDPQWVQS